MKYKTAIVGVTGIVGQQAIVALNNHPQFDLISFAASERSAGKTYRQAIETNGIVGWYADDPMPEEINNIKVQDAGKLDPSDYDIIFSCVDADVARELEPKFAKHCAVISTASAFRYDNDVPLIIPPVNPEQVSLIEKQRKTRNWKGFIAPIPNCTTTGLAITLKPLDQFGIESVIMTSLQAVSGAGRSPGVRALDIIDNVIPYIVGEEEKVEKEAQKILNKKFDISCTCTRVPVLNGHTESVFVQLKKPATIEQAEKAFSNFSSSVKTHSTPKQVIKVFSDPSRPQPRLDRETGNGLTTCVGRIRSDPVLGLKYVLVSHNSKMGAAAGAVWLAELLEQRGYI
ncbi:aspartate-semialdehyde dehydrogenase [Candidatus Micrarchaeota archaeon]|nr:aspartate-semialdehyde dehydrogenase [Candidatus Micrarchaeota archaeon]